MLNGLKYLYKARYLHAGAGVVMMPLGIAAVVLVLHQAQHHQVGNFQATLALTGAFITVIVGVVLTVIYLRP